MCIAVNAKQQLRDLIALGVVIKDQHDHLWFLLPTELSQASSDCIFNDMLREEGSCSGFGA